MASKVLRGLTRAALAVATTASPTLTWAADGSIQGFIRQEAAFSVSPEANPFNQSGNPFNGSTVVLDSTAIGGARTTATRTVPEGDGDSAFNYLATRIEFDGEYRFSDEWTGTAKLRGLFAPDVYDQYGMESLFEVPLHGDSGTMFELAGDNYMVDLPALYLDYADGPLWLRFGNQQIAWGESLFFRVLDVPNGLDYRRHSILDLVSEEFADERVPAPGIRASYRVNDAVQVEGFGQMFTPSIIPNANTPYNVIPSQFEVHQEEGYDAVDRNVNVGGRVQVQAGDLGLQFIAVNRRNPDGVYRWRKSGVNRDLPGVPGTGAILSETPFEVDPTGVRSAHEWFTYAGMSRLNGATALDAAVRDFPAATSLGAFDTGGNMGLAGAELDSFFQASGGLRGHLERVYPRETILGIGANYIFNGEPGTLLDQLVVRSELTYTPNKKFTNPNLGYSFIESDEIVASLTFEKYHRFTEDFPATFMVAQYLFKSESDLFGRHLSGNGGGPSSVSSGTDNFHAFAFALQQPFPNLVWRADLSVLYDVNGGALIQPALRWKPNAAWTMDIFANLLMSDGGNDDIVSTVDWADEVGIRVGLQF